MCDKKIDLRGKIGVYCWRSRPHKRECARQNKRKNTLSGKNSGKIAIVDYGAGNLFSVVSAFARANANVCVAASPRDINGCAGLVLPGVGAFGYAADALRQNGFFAALKEHAAAGTPLLGICLGMQLLFSESEESPGAEGLGLLPGRVTRLCAGDLKTPHMGWTDLQNRRGRLLSGVLNGAFVYFVHSYAVHSEGCAAAVAEYGETFDAAVAKGNVFATQFHPEKSSAVGATILQNFVRLCGEGERA